METSHWEVQKVLKVVGGYLGALTHSQSLTSLLLSKSFVLSFSLSVLSDSVIPWTIAHLAPLSMGFPRQAYWSGLPFPPPGDLPEPGMETFSSIGRQILYY